MDELHTVQTHKTGTRPSGANGLTKLLAGVLVVIILIGAGFMAGISYQKNHGTYSTGNTRFAQGAGQGRFGAQRPGGIGSVTAVSDSSVSVQNDRTSSTTTYTINSSTTVTNNGSSASVADIKVGDTVVVETSSSTSTTATRIVLNPSFGGGPGFDQQSSGSTDPSTTDSTNTVTN